MKLEIGMYCYHKNNRKYGIGKILKIEKNNNCLVDYNIHIGLVSCGNLVASFSPIDLIEVGDYVNGELVQDITGEYIRIGNISHNKSWLSNNIKTILTKEQFENNCYILQGEEVKDNV